MDDRGWYYMTQQCDTTTSTYVAVGAPADELLKLAEFSRSTRHLWYRVTTSLRSLECRALRVLLSCGNLQGSTSPHPHMGLQSPIHGRVRDGIVQGQGRRLTALNRYCTFTL